MPLINDTFDSLPYIDHPPTAAELAAAASLIAASLPTPLPATHPLLPPSPPPPASPLLALELTRHASSTALSAIDLKRYESLPRPPADASLSALQSAVATSHTSATYLQHRLQNLERLQASGKEEWLAGNEAVAAVLAEVERELAGTKEGIDRLATERRAAQEAVKGEMEVLERGWREGVGRVVATEVAAEELRGEILERRRAGAR